MPASTSNIHLLHYAEPAQRWVLQHKQQGQRVVLVPTMGALHAGHMALVDTAKAHGDKVIVSIFVNPTQFGANEDFSTYPRQLELDMTLCASHGVDVIFAPQLEEIYPADYASFIALKTPLTDCLCGAARPGHFDGVATIVLHLFTLLQPDAACFGEKDFQQLQVIRRVRRDFHLPVEIIPVPTIREHDGLAMSSRNMYLSKEDRAIAPKLYQQLQATAHAIRSGQSVAPLLQQAREQLRPYLQRLDYFELRREADLENAEHWSAEKILAQPCRLLIAAKLGSARLIDNLAI